MTVSTALYRHYDADGVLLYIGISLSAVSRLSAHMRGASWASQIAKVTVSTFPSRTEAAEAERAAIVAERPRFNIVHSTTRHRKPIKNRSSKKTNGVVEHYECPICQARWTCWWASFVKERPDCCAACRERGVYEVCWPVMATWDGKPAGETCAHERVKRHHDGSERCRDCFEWLSVLAGEQSP